MRPDRFECWLPESGRRRQSYPPRGARRCRGPPRLGQLAKQYYGGGRTLDAGKLKGAFAPLLEQGQGLIGRYGAEIADRARTIDVRNLPALIKTA